MNTLDAMLFSANLVDHSIRNLEAALDNLKQFPSLFGDPIATLVEEETFNLAELRSAIIRKLVEVDENKNKPVYASAPAAPDNFDDIPF